MQSRNRSNAQGIDVSRYQGVVDWAKVKASGKSFVFIKASQGTSLEDPRFAGNAQGAKAAGMLIGAYPYLEASNITEQRDRIDELEQRLGAIEKNGGSHSG
ncbi:glycoside hydrolase family 25 protein [Paenibacillus glucanolyticus]|uniref:glycoside hydrolase family 25 protein n=1 Tax=Paenibacillus glucanolyticus TaxID=59843 RepID=UPI00128C007B|nr:GH25 family lysozyme [Paenibacillus glucanolyticus]MPY20555.1 hypothetical protein [Paenibacillus glucanolyticus]